MRSFRWLVVVAVLAGTAPANVARSAAPIIPGSGKPIYAVGDDFEDESWDYVPNWPKSSNNIDKRTRNPGGFSTNGRWFEAALRGQPDYLKRVTPPPGGIKGSAGALMIRTLQSGIPGAPSGTDQQDDLIANLRSRVGTIPISYEPNVVTHVYLPPVEQWENRSGSQFAFRAGVRGGAEMEEFWPGIFVQFQSETDSRARTDAPFIVIRADGRGRDMRSIAITQTGWWTLGMSFTMDGRVHYFAHPGVEPLTEKDYLASHTPYSMPVRRFETFFFDVFNMDNGRTWSTPFIVDDTTLYVIRGGDQLEAIANRSVPRKTTTQVRQQAPAQQQQRQAAPQNRTAGQTRPTVKK